MTHIYQLKHKRKFTLCIAQIAVAQPADKTVTHYNAGDAHLPAERCVTVSGQQVTLLPYTVCAIEVK